MNLKEAQDTTVFVVEDNEIEEVNLYDFIMESVDETTTPRGVAPRDFIEEIEIKEDDEYYLWDEFRHLTDEEKEKGGVVYTISSWGASGNNYSQGDRYYMDEEYAENEFFKGVWEYDFLPDDQRNTCYYESFEEAGEDLYEGLSCEWCCDIEVVKSVLRKQEVVEIGRKKQIELIEKTERERVEKLVDIYSKMIEKQEDENYKTTCARLSKAIGSKIEGKVFHKSVKEIRLQA